MSNETVTAEKLAKALRKILESNSVDVLGTRTLLARYDAQQSNPSPVLVPTRNCSMADTGDFDECCIVCGESTDGGHSPERCIENIEGGIRQVIKFELSEELQRTKDELAKVDRIPGPSKRALSEVEQAALEACGWWTDDDWRGASVSMKKLRDALKRIGAL